MSNVSKEHQAPLEVMREHPETVLDLLRVSGLEIGSSPGSLTVVTSDSELTDGEPAPRRADLVVVIRDVSGRPVLNVIVEVQRRINDAKLRAWPLYAALLVARTNVPTRVLVMAMTERVAKWASRPSSIWSSLGFEPLLVSWKVLPAISTSEDVLMHPSLGVITALIRIADTSKRRRSANDEEVLRIVQALLKIRDRSVREYAICDLVVGGREATG